MCIRDRSRIEWLRVNLHWLVSDQHRNLGWRHVLARDDARSIASDEARVRNSESRVVERGHREVVSSERSVDDLLLGIRRSEWRALPRDVLSAVNACPE